MKQLLVGVFVLASTLISAQEVRYYDSLFKKTERLTETYFTKDAAQLQMDIFMPKNDKDTLRPMLLYVHGGGFQGGKRDEPNHLNFCESFARMGYVTATMSYTLVRKGKGFDCKTPAHEKVETFLLTAQDISRATRYLIKNAKRLGIDPKKIVLLGSSAGAEGVLHAAYWEKTYSDPKGQILPSDFRYGGVVSMAGAITEIDWIDRDSAIPTQLFHGTCDNLVPYDYASHHYCDPTKPGYLMLHGAKAISDNLRELGKPYYLVTGCFGRHEWAGTPLEFYQDAIRDFTYNDVVLGRKRQMHEFLSAPPEAVPCESWNSFNFCDQ